MLMMPMAIMVIDSEDDRYWMGQMYARHQALMMKTARAMAASVQDAEDIVADSVVSLIGQIPLLRGLPEGELRAYVTVAVRNAAVSRWRKARREKERALDEGRANHSAPDEETPERALLCAEGIEAVRRALRQLPDRDRDILRMKIFEEKTDREISQITGLAESSVRKYVERARKKLRARLDEEARA